MRSAEPLVEKEEPAFKADLRIEGIAQDVIVKDEERMGQLQNVVDKLRSGNHTTSIIEDLEKIHGGQFGASYTQGKPVGQKVQEGAGHRWPDLSRSNPW